jgi:hypothetical protein
MSKVRLAVSSAIGAIILTAVSAVAVLLYLMFSTDDEDIRREGLFGSVAVEIDKLSDGGLGLTAGVEDPIRLFLVFLVLAFFIAATQIVYGLLKQRRAQLMERSHIQG